MSQTNNKKLILGGRILIFEENKNLQEELSSLLADHGLEVCVTDTISGLQEMTSSFDPHIILLVAEDHDLMQRLLEQTASTATVRKASIFACHPFAEHYTRKQAIDSGVHELLSWPLDNEELIHRATTALQARRRMRENRENVHRLADALATIERHNQAYDEELEEAKVLQQVFFPRQRLIANGFALNFRIVPAQKLCGDFIDINRLDTFRIAIALIDVSGHGAAAAMVTGMVHAWLHANLHSHVSLKEKVEELNHYLYTYTPTPMYVTGFLAILDTMAGTIEYILAGHHEPLVWRMKEKTVHPLPEATTPALGLSPDISATVRRYEIGEGDALMIYSDGILDAFAHEKNSQDSLRDLYTRHNLSMACLRNKQCRMIEEVLQYGRKPDDDMAMLCLTRYSRVMQLGHLRINIPAVGHYQFTMPSTEDALRELQDFLAHNIREEINDDTFWDLMQVASELTRNAAEWGNGYRAERQVRCTITLSPKEVRLVVEDEGDGFDPQQTVQNRNEEDLAPDIRPGGFGLKICRELSDELLIENQGRQIEVVFRLQAENNMSRHGRPG